MKYKYLYGTHKLSVALLMCSHLQYYLLLSFYNFSMLKNYNPHRRGERLLKTTRHLIVILVLMPKRCAQYCVWVKNKTLMFTFSGNLTIPFISTLIHQLQNLTDHVVSVNYEKWNSKHKRVLTRVEVCVEFHDVVYRNGGMCAHPSVRPPK